MGINQLVSNIQPKNVLGIRPGSVGSVGDVVVKTRFRQSTPEMPWAYDPYWQGARANKLGSNVQDGDSTSFDSKGGPANVNDLFWHGGRDFKHQYGIEIHDARPPDKWSEPIVSFQGAFSWKRKLSTMRIAKRSGSLFSIKPNGYSPSNELSRGGNGVRITDQLGGDPGLELLEDPSKKPATNNPGLNPVNAGISRLGLQEGQVAGENSVYHPVSGIRRRVSNLNI